MLLKNKNLFLFIFCSILITGALFAGTLTNTSAPTPTMYTLEDIYNLIHNNATSTHSLSTNLTPAKSMHSVSDIYVDLANLIQASDLASTSVTYLGVTGGGTTPTPIATTTHSFTPSTSAGTPTGFTLDNIYHLIHNNTRPTTTTHSFTPPALSASQHTLTEIYTDLSTLIIANQIATGTKYLGVMGSYVAPDPCNGTPGIGTVCTGGALYAGEYGNYKYMTTPNDAPGFLAWSTENIVTNAISMNYGQSNTKTLSELVGVYPAADYCAALSYGGYDDWYLPAENEISTVLYNNKTALGGFASSGFPDVFYLSSTEETDNNVFIVTFNDGGQIDTTKDYAVSVRCVRSNLDITPPAVTTFTIPVTASSLTINITTLTATDDKDVAGYLLTESSSAPSTSTPGWSGNAPATYTFSTAGNKTLYAWAKDAAGNVSALTASSTATVVITIPVILEPVYLTSPSMNFLDNEDLTANISDYSSLSAYQYNWYKNNNLDATTLINDPRLVLYLPMDNNLSDYKHSYNSSVVGDVSQTANGKVGGGYFIGGSGGSIVLPWSWIGFGKELNKLIGHGYGYYSPHGESNTTGYTISLWMKPNMTIASSDTTMRNLYWGGNGVHITFADNFGRSPTGGELVLTQYQVFGAGPTNAVSPSQTWNADQWYHIVATWDLSNLNLYVDGELAGSAPRVAPPNDWWPEPWNVVEGVTKVLAIGGDSNGANSFNGTVDEFMVLSQAISPAEVTSLYFGGLYGGNKMGAIQTNSGEAWKVGFSSNNLGGDNWTSEINSAPVIITP